MVGHPIFLGLNVGQREDSRSAAAPSTSTTSRTRPCCGLWSRTSSATACNWPRWCSRRLGPLGRSWALRPDSGHRRATPQRAGAGVLPGTRLLAPPRRGSARLAEGSYSGRANPRRRSDGVELGGVGLPPRQGAGGEPKGSGANHPVQLLGLQRQPIHGGCRTPQGESTEAATEDTERRNQKASRTK